MGDVRAARAPAARRGDPARGVHRRSYDPVTRAILEAGGLFPFVEPLQGRARSQVPPPTTARRPMTMAEKILAQPRRRRRGQTVLREARRRVPRERRRRLQPRVHDGAGALLPAAGVRRATTRCRTRPSSRSSRTTCSTPTACKRMAPFAPQIQTLRDLQREFQRHTGVRDYSAKDGISPGICHQVAREQFVDPGDFIQATDSHTCMGGGNNALTWGVGATEYAGLVYAGFTFVSVPESIRFELARRSCGPACTAKDVMLHILDDVRGARGHARPRDGVRRAGPRVALDGRARDAVQHGHRVQRRSRASARPTSVTLEWLAARRPGVDRARRSARASSRPTRARTTTAACTRSTSRRSSRWSPSPATRRTARTIAELGDVADRHRLRGLVHGRQGARPRLLRARAARRRRRRPRASRRACACSSSSAASPCATTRAAAATSRSSQQAGVEVIEPGCGACIGCGPGVSDTKEQVTVSAINRNFAGRAAGRASSTSPRR